MRERIHRFQELLGRPIAFWSRWALGLAVVPLALSFTQPLWNIRMLAPQYPKGLELVYRLARTADVFLTNKTPPVLRKLKIDVADLRRQNPRIIYTRGTAFGPRGPDGDRGGYDLTSIWCRSGRAASRASSRRHARSWPRICCPRAPCAILKPRMVGRRPSGFRWAACPYCCSKALRVVRASVSCLRSALRAGFGIVRSGSAGSTA